MNKRNVTRIVESRKPSIEAAATNLMSSLSGLTSIIALLLVAGGVMYLFGGVIGTVLNVVVNVVGALLLLVCSVCSMADFLDGWKPTQEELANGTSVKDYLLRRQRETKTAVAKLSGDEVTLEDEEAVLVKSYNQFGILYVGYTVLLVTYVVTKGVLPIVGVLSIVLMAFNALVKFGMALSLRTGHEKVLKPVNVSTIREMWIGYVRYLVPAAYVITIMMTYFGVF